PSPDASKVARPLVERHLASFSSSSASRFINLSSGFNAVFIAVEGKHGGLAIDERLQMHRPAPDKLNVRQGVGRLIQAQLDAGVLVFEQQFAAVAEIAVYYINPRFSEVRQAE